MTYELTIDGTKYYFVNEADYNKVKDAGTVEEQKELVSQYKSSEVSTDEDDLVEVDDSDETEGTEGSGSNDEVSYKGYDDTEFEAFCSTVGLNNLTEDSSVDDLKTIFQNIEKEISSIERKIKGINMDDPESINDIMTDMITIYAGLEAFGEGLGLDINTGGEDGRNTGLVIGALAGAGGMIAGAKLGAIGGSLAGPIGTVIGAVVGGIAGALIGFFTGDKSKDLEDLKEDVQKSLESFAQKFTEVQTQFTEYTEDELIPDIEEELEGLLDGEFKFEDINDTRNITDNLDNIIECQQKIEPYMQIAENFGIDCPKLKELADKLGTGDDALQYAQEYIDSYADAVDLTLTDDVVADTGTLNEIYESVSEIITEAQSRGLKTDKLEDLLKKTQETNQSAADDTADGILDGAGSGLQPYTVTTPSSGGTTSYGTGTTGGTQSANTGVVDNTTSAIESAQTAEKTSEGVESNSSSYDTSTESLDNAGTTLRESAQEQVNSYLESVSTGGISISELESLYGQVSATYEELKDLSGEVDLSGFESKLNEIREAQQSIINEYARQMSSSVQSTSTSSERKELLANIEATMNQYAEINIDFSGLSAVIGQIKDKEQQYINEQTQIANNLVQNSTSKEEVTSAINNITVIINESSGLNCDVSGLQAAIEQLNLKLEQLMSNSENTQTPENENTGADFDTKIQNITTAIQGSKSLASLSALKNEVDLLMNEAVQNSYPTEALENLYLMIKEKANELSGEVVKDNEETVDKTTNIEILNEVAINVNNNIIHVINVNADTAQLQDLLQKIYDKINELTLKDPEEEKTEPDCEPEDELPIEDNPNIDTPASGIIDPNLGVNDGTDEVEPEQPENETAIPEDNTQNETSTPETVTPPVSEEIPEDNTAQTTPEQTPPVSEEIPEDNTAQTTPEQTPPAQTETDDNEIIEDDIPKEDTIDDTSNQDTITENDAPDCGPEDELPVTDIEGSVTVNDDTTDNDTQNESGGLIIEGEDGHDIELDFEEEEK